MSELHLADYARLLDAKYPAGVSVDPTEHMSPEDKAKWDAMNAEHGDKFKAAQANISVGDQFKDSHGVVWVVSEPNRGGTVHAYPKNRGERFAQPVDVADLQKRYTRVAGEESDADAKFEKGKPADPTKNMDEAEKAEWEKQKRENADQFKAAGDDIERYRTTWARQAGSGASNAKYLDGLPAPKKEKILKAVAKHYGVSTREIEGELKDREAEDLYEYLAFDNGLAMQVYRDFKRMRLASDKEAASGLYGHTKAIQRDVEASVRKLQKAATQTAKRAWKRDPRVAAFLTAHASRANSAPARLLLAALKAVGPKVASQSRLALDSDQEVLYDALMMLAENDGKAYAKMDARQAVANAYESYRRSQGENLRADFRAVKGLLEKDLAKQWADTHKYAAYRPAPADLAEAKALVGQYLRRGRPFTFDDLYMDDAGLADLDLYQAVSDLISDGIIDGPDPLDRSTRGNHGDWIYRKTSSGPVENPTYKTAKGPEFGMYGYHARTARLGLDACSDIREAAGRIAYGLHTRRQAKYSRITAFLKEHSKAAKCRYSRLLLSSYPDAPALSAKRAEDETVESTKTASTPTGVDEWLAWE